MKIVFLDALSMGEDVDFSEFEKLGEFIPYPSSTPDQAEERTRDADVVLTNKVVINEKTIGQASHLKLVCETATGTNNLDKEYLAQRDIPWKNVAGYSTDIVAQHTFALLLYIYEKLHSYDAYVKDQSYMNSGSFTHFTPVFHELSGKTWGIIGMGAIGHRVADIAKAFGCRVIYYSTSGKNNQPDYPRVSWEELLTQSDIVSVHAPLTPQTQGLLNKEAFQKMKNTAYLINVGRGPIVVEEDLAEALEVGEIAGAGLDVLSTEPMTADNPLNRIKDSQKLIITPHMAWASVEARSRLLGMTLAQIKEIL